MLKTVRFYILLLLIASIIIAPKEVKADIVDDASAQVWGAFLDSEGVRNACSGDFCEHRANVLAALVIRAGGTVLGFAEANFDEFNPITRWSYHIAPIILIGGQRIIVDVLTMTRYSATAQGLETWVEETAGAGAAAYTTFRIIEAAASNYAGMGTEHLQNRNSQLAASHIAGLTTALTVIWAQSSYVQYSSAYLSVARMAVHLVPSISLGAAREIARRVVTGTTSVAQLLATPMFSVRLRSRFLTVSTWSCAIVALLANLGFV